MLIFGELFAGVGMASHGFEKAGWKGKIMIARRSYAGEKICEECGQIFLLRSDAAKKSNRGKYCSVVCSNKGRSMPLMVDFGIVRRMYIDDRRTTREIAAQLGTTWRHVSCALKQNGVPLYHHRRAHKRACSRTYRRIVEKSNGVRLTELDIVHHLNCDPCDNRPENLTVVTRSRHSGLHKQLENIAAKLYEMGIVTYDTESGYEIVPYLIALMDRELVI